jgi:hypothetical protein
MLTPPCFNLYCDGTGVDFTIMLICESSHLIKRSYAARRGHVGVEEYVDPLDDEAFNILWNLRADHKGQ